MTKKLVAKVGEYEKDGQTKGRYVNLGVILSNDNGEYAILDPSVNLAGALQQQNMMNHGKGKKPSDRLMVSIFTDNPQGGNQSQGQQGGGGVSSTDFDDDLPF